MVIIIWRLFCFPPTLKVPYRLTIGQHRRLPVPSVGEWPHTKDIDYTSDKGL